MKFSLDQLFKGVKYKWKSMRYDDKYVAEVDVELREGDTGWSPYLKFEDVHKLDDVRDTLRYGYLESA